MEYEIILPEIKIDEKERRQRINAMFKNDFDKGGILASSFIFVYLNQPCSISEVTDKMASYYQKSIEKVSISRALKKLQRENLLHTTESGNILLMNNSEQTDIHKKILLKFNRFLETIPVAFRGKYTDVKYYWLTKKEGESYLSWCSKMLNFEIKPK